MGYYEKMAEMRRYVKGILERNDNINEKLIIKVVADRFGFVLATKKYLRELEELGEIVKDNEGNIKLCRIKHIEEDI